MLGEEELLSKGSPGRMYERATRKGLLAIDPFVMVFARRWWYGERENREENLSRQVRHNYKQWSWSVRCNVVLKDETMGGRDALTSR